MTLKLNRLAAAILATLASTAYAEEQKHHFDIPAQALGSALQTLAAQSGALMLYAEQTAAGKQSPRLVGDYTTAEAADKLLAGSGLDHSVAENGTVTVKPAQQNTAPIMLKPMTVTGNTKFDPNDPFNKNYAVTNSSTATKTDTPIMEMPVSIQVVSRAVLDDQQAIRLQDTIKNVSGVQRDITFGNGYESFTIRGFSSASNFYRNGVRMITQSSETAHLNQIEILKGPAAMLFGRVEPGGLVNVVTKKPLEQAYYSL